MPIVYQKHITRNDVQINHTKLYVFGDNLMRVGYGGQAKAMRGEPNAVGIPTKVSPAMYLSDDRDFLTLASEYSMIFSKLSYELENGKTIVWPEDGIGTGLADMEKQAPLCWQLLQSFISYLHIINKATTTNG